MTSSHLQNVSAVLTAQNTFTNWLIVDKGKRFSLDVWGTFNATVTLQKSYDGGETILDSVSSFTSPIDKISEPMPETTQFRIGVKTGNYSSGTINVRLGRD